MKLFFTVLAALLTAGLIFLLGFTIWRASEKERELRRGAESLSPLVAVSPAPTPSPTPYFVRMTMEVDVYAVSDQTRLLLTPGTQVKVVMDFDTILVIEHEGRLYPIDRAITTPDK